MPGPVITLTTDFGAHGPYVAAMKGVILGLNSAAAIVDVSHEIAPQNVRESALTLWQIAPYFPAGTIHVVVVDPGVGTARRLLCVRMHDQLFLGPDNGVLSWIPARRNGALSLDRFELTNARFWRPEISITFHGRDILAPAAAHLSLGVRPDELGRPVSDWVELPWPVPRVAPHRIEGEVIATDRFGNLITNVAASDIAALAPRSVRIEISGQAIAGLARTYADVAVGELLALIGSSGLVEVAERNGSAVQRLGSGVADPVAITNRD